MKTIQEIILEAIQGQKFADWYNTGRFDDYITGQEPKITKEEILKDIVKIFKLDK